MMSKETIERFIKEISNDTDYIKIYRSNEFATTHSLDRGIYSFKKGVVWSVLFSTNIEGIISFYKEFEKYRIRENSKDVIDDYHNYTDKSNDV